jgi:hypothetical protein
MKYCFKLTVTHTVTVRNVDVICDKFNVYRTNLYLGNKFFMIIKQGDNKSTNRYEGLHIYVTVKQTLRFQLKTLCCVHWYLLYSTSSVLGHRIMLPAFYWC